MGGFLDMSFGWKLTHGFALFWNALLFGSLAVELLTTGNLSLSVETAHTLRAVDVITLFAGLGTSLACLIRALFVEAA